MAVRASKDSIWPYGRIAWHFGYRSNDHDEEEKTFLGKTGNFNGKDVIEIICREPETARFVCTRLFQFFVADEVNEDGYQLIETMMATYFASRYEIRSMLRTMLNSDYFKSEKTWFARVKAPVEHIVGAIRLAGTYRTPTHGVEQIANHSFYMGQRLLDPPSVEGWHEGTEWIDSGALVERINFVSKELGNVSNPGVRSIIERIAISNGHALSPDELVDRCLDLLGPITVSAEVQATLVKHVAQRGEVDLRDHQQRDELEQRVGELLSLIASTREFQLA